MSHLFMQLSDLPKIIIAEKYSLFICGLVYKEMKGLTLSITGYLIKKKKKLRGTCILQPLAVFKGNRTNVSLYGRDTNLLCTSET